MSESLSIQHNILSIVRMFQITGSRFDHLTQTLLCDPTCCEQEIFLHDTRTVKNTYHLYIYY